MFRFLNQRSVFGYSKSASGLCQPVDLSYLLMKYKNYCHDEYSTLDENGMSVPPMACKFASSQSRGHILSVVDEDGYIVMYDVNKSGQEAVMKTWQVHCNAVFDVEWVHDDSQILTASGDQTIALWDIERTYKLESFKGHSSSVRSISQRIDDNAVFASGSRDGHVMIWDKRIAHKDGSIHSVDTILNAHTIQSHHRMPGKTRKMKQTSSIPKGLQQSVTAVLFQDENYLVSAGSMDGCIKVWDIRKTHKRCPYLPSLPVRVLPYQGRRRHGYSSLTCDHNRRRLFASCTDDSVYEYNLMSLDDKPVSCFRGHKNSSFYVKTAISPNNQFLLSGSSDFHAYIWQINKPEASPIVLKAHDSEVTSVEWCKTDFTKLVTLSDDARTKFWRIYSRDLKSELHPQWFGRARRFSRESSTSTIETSKNPTTSSSSTSVSSPHGKLKTPTLDSKASPSSSLQPVSKSPSVREWLKRKPPASVDEDQSPLSKSLCRTHDNKISTDEATSPVARPEIRKRSFASKRATGEYESIPDTSDNYSNSNIVDTFVGQHKALSDETPTKKVKVDGTVELCESIPKSNFSPVKPSKSQISHFENIHHPSPQKLKHGLNLEDSPVSSPKRQCLTKLDANGAFQRLSSARQSLFGNRESTDNESQKELTSYSVMNVIEPCDTDSRLPEPHLCKDITNNNSACASSPCSCKTLKSPENINSPTQNLPNLVRDQLLNLQSTSPRRLTSPQAKKVDWLTQLRLSKTKKSGDEEPVQLTRQSPNSARSSPKIMQGKNIKRIDAYFSGQNNKGNL